ncbi:MAG: putative metalloprotease CJM1_0395 family protein [Desulforhopalus sp.]
MELSTSKYSIFPWTETAQHRQESAGGHRQVTVEKYSKRRDSVTLSPDGIKKHEGSPNDRSDCCPDAENKTGTLLHPEDLAKLEKLKLRDSEVRRHEQAHLSAAGRFARGGVSYSYEKGPDGVAYATGGEVGIDVSKASSPEATITKMQAVKRAALAPQNPSAADRRIASHASMKEAQARKELLQAQQVNLLTEETDQPVLNGNRETTNSPSPKYHQLEAKLMVYKDMSAA